jgi:hypothetical protein
MEEQHADRVGELSIDSTGGIEDGFNGTREGLPYQRNEFGAVKRD